MKIKGPKQDSRTKGSKQDSRTKGPKQDSRNQLRYKQLTITLYVFSKKI
jgi:hypothetical protein